MEKIINFGDIEIQKQTFYQHEEPISIKNIDINKIVVSIRSLLAKKNLNILLATKMLKKLDLYVNFSQKLVHIQKTLMKLMMNDELLEKCNEIWEKVKNIIKKEFDSDPVYNKKHLKAKIKSCNGKIDTNFHNNKIPKEGSQFICLSVNLIDSVFRTGKTYYPVVFLKECKYVIKEKKIPKFIIYDIETFSHSDRENFDEENSDEENFEKENSDEENFDEILARKNKKNSNITIKKSLIFFLYI